MWLELFFFSLRPLLALVPLRLGVTDAKSRTRCVVGCGAVFVSLLLQQGRPLAAKLGCKPYSLVPSNGCQVLNQLIIFIYFFFLWTSAFYPGRYRLTQEKSWRSCKYCHREILSRWFGCLVKFFWCAHQDQKNIVVSSGSCKSNVSSVRNSTFGGLETGVKRQNSQLLNFGILLPQGPILLVSQISEKFWNRWLRLLPIVVKCIYYLLTFLVLIPSFSFTGINITCSQTLQRWIAHLSRTMQFFPEMGKKKKSKHRFELMACFYESVLFHQYNVCHECWTMLRLGYGIAEHTYRGFAANRKGALTARTDLDGLSKPPSTVSSFRYWEVQNSVSGVYSFLQPISSVMLGYSYLQVLFI